MKNYVKSNWLLLLALVIPILIFGTIILFDRNSDLALNLFSEFIGVAFTVIVIDRLLQENDLKKNLGPRTLAYKRINSFVSNYIWFWRELYVFSVPKLEPKTIAEFFSHDYISLIWNHLDLNAKPINEDTLKKIPQYTQKDIFTGNYWEFIPNRFGRFNKEILEITGRFGSYIEPEIYEKLNAIIDSETFKRLCDLNNKPKTEYDNRNEKPDSLDRRPLLICWAGSQSMFKKYDFENIIYLYNWCLQNRNSIKCEDGIEKTKYSNFIYNQRIYNYGTPLHMITDFEGNDKPKPCL
jgi:hypothetical protein